MLRISRLFFFGVFPVLFLATCFAVGFLWTKRILTPPPMVVMPAIPATPTPSPVPKTSKATWLSPDGKKVLIARTTEEGPDKTRYSFAVIEEGKPGEQPIYTQTVQAGVSIHVPYNTWAPDNKHIFLEKKEGTTKRFVVFKASGQSFGKETFLDINEYYVQKKITQDFGDVTGWASATLLIVKTKEVNSTADGPSYWFDITRPSFIRLSTNF